MDNNTDNNNSEDFNIRLRSELKPGDIGWIIARHGQIYSQHYGWSENFEIMVSKISSAFFDNYRKQFEKYWFAEISGEKVGFALVAREDDCTANLRLLFVEPNARGRGIGTRLVDECIDFAKHAGYAKLTLWTNKILTDAAKIYLKRGFKLLTEETHSMFGPQTVGQSYELML